MPKTKSRPRVESRAPDSPELVAHVDPLVQALIDQLPPPGEPWGQAERALWLQILGLSLNLIYPNEDEPGG